jgi:hypothetical protein
MPDYDWSLFGPLEAVHYSFLFSLSERLFTADVVFIYICILIAFFKVSASAT